MPHERRHESRGDSGVEFTEIPNSKLAVGMITYKESSDGKMVRDETLTENAGRCSQGVHFRCGNAKTGRLRTVCFDNAGKATIVV